MASLEEHQAYHNYILGTCTTMTGLAGATFLTTDNEIIGEDGEPLSKVTKEHIENFVDVELKDAILFQCLKAMELFEQKATTLEQVTESDLIREINTAE